MLNVWYMYNLSRVCLTLCVMYVYLPCLWTRALPRSLGQGKNLKKKKEKKRTLRLNFNNVNKKISPPPKKTITRTIRTPVFS